MVVFVWKMLGLGGINGLQNYIYKSGNVLLVKLGVVIRKMLLHFNWSVVVLYLETMNYRSIFI